MHEATVADVQRHVRGFPAFLREEQKVAALQLAARDRARHAAQLVGRATGGVINVITRSGGNDFHGDVFGYYFSDALQSNPAGVLPP